MGQVHVAAGSETSSTIQTVVTRDKSHAADLQQIPKERERKGSWHTQASSDLPAASQSLHLCIYNKRNRGKREAHPICGNALCGATAACFPVAMWRCRCRLAASLLISMVHWQMTSGSEHLGRGPIPAAEKAGGTGAASLRRPSKPSSWKQVTASGPFTGFTLNCKAITSVCECVLVPVFSSHSFDPWTLNPDPSKQALFNVNLPLHLVLEFAICKLGSSVP